MGKYNIYSGESQSAAWAQGETIEELNENLTDAVKMLLEDGKPAVESYY
jgi:predicted RNase H-like HicB family nuclease